MEMPHSPWTSCFSVWWFPFQKSISFSCRS